jgi:hypothetical protein
MDNLLIQHKSEHRPISIMFKLKSAHRIYSTKSLEQVPKC